jgi:hypothetical protein
MKTFLLLISEKVPRHAIDTRLYWHRISRAYLLNVKLFLQFFFLFYEMRSKTKRRNQILIQIYRWIDWFIGILRHFGRILTMFFLWQFSNWNVLFCMFGFLWRPQTSGTRYFVNPLGWDPWHGAPFNVPSDGLKNNSNELKIYIRVIMNIFKQSYS